MAERWISIWRGWEGWDLPSQSSTDLPCVAAAGAHKRKFQLIGEDNWHTDEFIGEDKECVLFSLPWRSRIPFIQDWTVYILSTVCKSNPISMGHLTAYKVMEAPLGERNSAAQMDMWALCCASGTQVGGQFPLKMGWLGFSAEAAQSWNGWRQLRAGISGYPLSFVD